MKYHTPLITAALLALLFTGCSKHPPAATSPQVIDLGVVKISDGTPIRRVLREGEFCVITPTVTTNGSARFVKMGMTIERLHSTKLECPQVVAVAGQPVEFKVGDVDIRLTTELKP